jgi:uroporphyrin-III C-methyltransferase/precorrin-2 dehydrogenase/sirohydrochlorin ferrochelatase
MQHFPIFVAMQDARVVLSGGDSAALAKLRLLMKTPARIDVYAQTPLDEIVTWAEEGRLNLYRRALRAADLTGARLVYAADEDAERDGATLALAQEARVLANIVDDLVRSEFITPAMVDRSPVTIAIGTEGAAPVLARQIKADLEARIPVSTGTLAQSARDFRAKAEVLPHGAARRAFWSDWFTHVGPATVDKGGDLEAALTILLDRHLSNEAAKPQVTLALADVRDPDLLIMKTRRALHEADVVVHDDDVSTEILELARREADFLSMARPSQVPPLHVLLAQLAEGGRHLLYLSTIPMPRNLARDLRSRGCDCTDIPGLIAQATENHTEYNTQHSKERA